MNFLSINPHSLRYLQHRMASVNENLLKISIFLINKSKAYGNSWKNEHIFSLIFNLKMETKKAYIQCDWTASKASGEKYNPKFGERYEELLSELKSLGIVNIATWSDTSKTEAYRENDRSFHAVRNCGEVDQSDMVITLLMRHDPPHFHWGSISVMAYALGKGKPCYVIADDECVVWKHHMMYHPGIVRVTTTDEIVSHFK